MVIKNQKAVNMYLAKIFLYFVINTIINFEGLRQLQ